MKGTGLCKLKREVHEIRCYILPKLLRTSQRWLKTSIRVYTHYLMPRSNERLVTHEKQSLLQAARRYDIYIAVQAELFTWSWCMVSMFRRVA